MCDVAAAMATTSCGWIRMSDNLLGVNAESSNNDCSYYRHKLGIFGGIPSGIR